MLKEFNMAVSKIVNSPPPASNLSGLTFHMVVWFPEIFDLKNLNRQHIVNLARLTRRMLVY